MLFFCHAGRFPILYTFQSSSFRPFVYVFFVNFFPIFLSHFQYGLVFVHRLCSVQWYNIFSYDFKWPVLWFCMFDGVIWNVSPQHSRLSNEFPRFVPFVVVVHFFIFILYQYSSMYYIPMLGQRELIEWLVYTFYFSRFSSVCAQPMSFLRVNCIEPVAIHLVLKTVQPTMFACRAII